MHFFIQCLLMLSLTISAQADEIYIPQQFKEGQPIEQIIVISDVDGVIRDSVEATADPRVIDAVKSLLEIKDVDVTFISGTPIENDLSVELWKRGNLALNKVFGSSFEKELAEARVAIYGVLGGHRMNADGSLDVVDEYSSEISLELGTLLIHAFLKEVLLHGSPGQKDIATHLQKELDSLEFEDFNSTNGTSQAFYPIVLMIREHLDPNFRLVSNGALIETQTSNPPWNTLFSSKWLREEMNQPQYHVSHLAPCQKQMATGVAKRGDKGFNFLLICKTNKGLTTKRHIEEKLKQFPRALIVTIGDTQVDFPMHQNAHIAFHVGLEQVWRNNSLPQCIMVRNPDGEDCQHVEGTLKVLGLLKEAIGKSLYDFKYIPQSDSAGQWNFYSIREAEAAVTIARGDVR